MKILLLHSDYIEYEIKKKTRFAEPFEGKGERVDEALVVFVSVEKGDTEDTALRAVEEIKDIAGKVNADKIVLYPYAHLSSDLADAETAVNLLKYMEKELSNEFEVYRSPFGWYKSFKISCKGHPLSELSREIKGEDIELTQALKDEEKAESYWYILTPEKELVEVDKFDFTGYENLKKFVDYEIAKRRAVDRTPPHVELMKKLEIADYEEASDSGHMRYHPNGRLIKSLLETFVTEKCVEYGAMEVETPIMYDRNHPTLRKYLERFPARQYIIKGDKRDFFLRFAACFGQFLMTSQATLTYKHLPFKMYELTRYSFRKEQRGELVGLRRLRAFTMPDMHTVVKDIEEAKEEFYNQYKLSVEVLKEIGLEPEDYEVAIRITKDFYQENRDFIHSIAEILGKPILIEVWDRRFFYFVLKFEFNFVDALDKASALSTVQIDVENAERYGITYVDSDGKEKYPYILHCSASGAIERVIYALLEKAFLKSKDDIPPMLPVWLSPTQVRIIPIAERHLEKAIGIAQELNRNRIRADVDDRDETTAKKVRDASTTWIPYIAVIGDREVEENLLSITVRKESTIGKQKKVKMTLEELINEVKKETEGKPYKPLPMHFMLSRRPSMR